MIGKTQLAILDYSARIGLQQIETKDGKKCFKQVFPKVTEGWYVKKVLSQKCLLYLEVLMKSTVDPKNTKSS